MTNTYEIQRASKLATILGWVLSVLPAGLLLFSGAMKFMPPNDDSRKMIEEHLGWPMRYMHGIAILEICVAIIFLIPQTAVLGAILLAGYMGGAIATHTRVGDPAFVQALVGIVAWLGLFLREPRLRSLVPIRKL